MIVTELTNPETLTQLLECGLQIILALAQGILDNLPELLGSMLEVISNLIGWFVTDGGPMILSAAGEMFEAIGEGLLNAWDFIVGKIGELFGKILGHDGIGGWGGDLIEKAVEIFENIGDGLVGAWEYVTGKISEFAEWMWGGLKEAFTGMWDFGKDLAENIWKGIKSMWSTLADALNPKNWLKGKGVSDDIKEWATKFGKETAENYVTGQQKGFDIHSPSKKMRWIGQMVMEGYTEGLEDESSDAFDAFSDMNKQISRLDAPSIDFGVSASGGGYGSQTSRIEELISAVNAMAQGLKVVIPVSVGDKRIDELVYDSKSRVVVRSGGQVYA